MSHNAARHTHSYTEMCTHAYAHRYTHTHIHKRHKSSSTCLAVKLRTCEIRKMHTHTEIHMDTIKCTRTQTHMHTIKCTRTRTRTHMQRQIQTHTHIHTKIGAQVFFFAVV